MSTTRQHQDELGALRLLKLLTCVGQKKKASLLLQFSPLAAELFVSHRVLEPSNIIDLPSAGHTRTKLGSLKQLTSLFPPSEPIFYSLNKTKLSGEAVDCKKYTLKVGPLLRMFLLRLYEKYATSMVWKWEYVKA